MSQELRLGTAPGWGAILRGERCCGGRWFELPAQTCMDTLRNGGVLIVSGYPELVRTSVTPKRVIGRRSHFEKIQFMRTELIAIAKLWEDNNRVDQRHSVIKLR